jgi:hypothetical protein
MTPLEEKQLLLRVVLRLAKEQLEKGGFIPFGAAMGTKRDVQLLMPKSMKQDVKQDELDAYWNKQFAPIVGGQDCKTVCTCADVGLTDDQGGLVLGVLTHIEHADSDAEDIFTPYTRDENSKVTFGLEPAKQCTALYSSHKVNIPEKQTSPALTL